jgi:hypothetical protein
LPTTAVGCLPQLTSHPLAPAKAVPIGSDAVPSSGNVQHPCPNSTLHKHRCQMRTDGRPSVLSGHNLQVAREMYAGSAGFWLNGIDNGC